MSVPVIAGVVASWLVPGAIFLILIVASWLGLRWIKSEHLETLRSIPLFSGLTQGQLSSVLGSSHAVEYQPGVRIVTEGEKGKGFFVLARGTVGVSISGKDVSTLGPGSYFGEIAVIDGGPRTATIGAESAVSALELTRPALLRLIDREPGVARAMYDQLQRHRSEPQSVTSADVQVTREMLVDLCAQLRRIDQPDFAKVQSSKRRWLGLSRLFARGE
ncbi:MAG TPA: cyclic nucleotide-binding domain-containing protein [Actinomycetota bacterium]